MRTLPISTAALLALMPGVAGAADCTASPDGTSIQQCIDQAEAGDTITVKGGTYHGSLNIGGKHGRAGAPIRLISTEGARLVGDPDSAVITSMSGVSHFVIEGLTLESTSSRGDIGGIKIYSNWSGTHTHNITIAGNCFTGTGQDAIKFSRGPSDIAIVGNVIEGRYREEGIDLLGVFGGRVAYNIFNHQSRWGSLIMKGGTHSIIVENNLFAGNNPKVMIGGVGKFQGGTYHPSQKQYMARNITVRGNWIKDVVFAGGIESRVEGNAISGTIAQKGGGDHPHRPIPSHSNIIRDNRHLSPNDGGFPPHRSMCHEESPAD